MEQLWNALADRNRRAVLDALAEGELSVGELVERLGMSQPRTSKHLRVLREAGLVRVQTQGPRRLYRVEPRPMAELDAWLAPYRRMWNRSLDRLGEQLDREEED
ncbi:ArsR/SmtB family transcription factor [Nocardioides caldifontis]|uniref:ArsR/SmtB family transcription factor n=1 Tax=Nocardioides caldifontis TaxID=2588938 RepID=UPI0011E0495D|nr:metalloregulator ArsR/SmtB family transcription factor [Nocardioides caldifontis]